MCPRPDSGSVVVGTFVACFVHAVAAEVAVVVSVLDIVAVENSACPVAFGFDFAIAEHYWTALFLETQTPFISKTGQL